jgi:membrane protein YqaA with SNARE-associated domain
MTFESLGLIGLFASAFISSTIAPGGSEAVLLYMVAENNQSITLLVIVATIGNTLGAMTTWWLGVWMAKKYPAEQVLTGKKQQSIDTVKKWGVWALLFSWLPVVGDGLCFAGGWLRLSIISSIIAITIGKAIRYTAVAHASLALI